MQPVAALQQATAAGASKTRELATKASITIAIENQFPLDSMTAELLNADWLWHVLESEIIS